MDASPQPNGNKRQQQYEVTKQKLLNVSLALFVSKGYDGTTIRDIAQSAGVSTSLIFHYFPSKQVILESHIQVAAQGVISIVGLLSNSDHPIETFRAIASMTLESFQHDTFKKMYLLVNQVLSFESIPSPVKQIMPASSQPLRATIPLIILGQKSGEIRAGDPLALSVAFWGAIQGIAEVLVWNQDAPVPDASCIMGILEST